MAHLQAPAKINLYLAVEEKLPSGYHRICSVIVSVPRVFDTVSVDRAPSGQLTMRCSHPDLPTDESNLCVQAANRFAEAAGVAPSWSIQLEKRIPIAAGLGGGSSDSAAVLRLLQKQTGAPLSDDELMRIASELGADVPFFLDPRPVLAEGVGEVLTPISLWLACGLILVNAGFPIPVRWAYAHWDSLDRPEAPSVDSVLERLKSCELGEICKGLHNDLEHCAFRKFPLLEMLREDMLRAGCAAVHVSGSGPTLFGLCPSGQTAAVADRLRGTVEPFGWLFAGELGEDA